MGSGDSVGDVADEVYRRHWVRHGLILTGLACVTGVLGVVGYIWVLVGFAFTRQWDWGVAAAVVVAALVCVAREVRRQCARLRLDQRRTAGERADMRYDCARANRAALAGGRGQWWRRNRRRPSWWIAGAATGAAAWSVAQVLGSPLWGVGYGVLYVAVGVAGTRQAARVADIVLFDDPRQPRYTPET